MKMSLISLIRHGWLGMVTMGRMKKLDKTRRDAKENGQNIDWPFASERTGYQHTIAI